MSEKHHTKTTGVRRRGVSPLMRAVSAALGCLWLTASFAQAMDGISLTRQNQLSAPYPSSFPRQVLAKAARIRTTTSTPAPVLAKVATPAPERHSVLELAMQGRTDPSVYEQMEQTPVREPSPALMEAIIGSGHPTSAHTKVKIGYGKALADNSNTVGTKNGTRLEEPGCLYVKTSVNF